MGAMKRIVTVLLLVAAFAVVSTALAQAQRWEYAYLYRGQSNYVFGAPGVELLLFHEDLYSRLIELYGPYGGPLESEYSQHLDILNILGNAGWELTTAVGGPGGLEYFFKRPLRD